MGIIKCGECGVEFDDSLNSCPNCGCPVEISKEEDEQTDSIKLNEEEIKLEADNIKNENERLRHKFKLLVIFPVIWVLILLISLIIKEGFFLILSGVIGSFIVALIGIGTCNRIDKNNDRLRELGCDEDIYTDKLSKMFSGKTKYGSILTIMGLILLISGFTDIGIAKSKDNAYLKEPYPCVQFVNNEYSTGATFRITLDEFIEKYNSGSDFKINKQELEIISETDFKEGTAYRYVSPTGKMGFNIYVLSENNMIMAFEVVFLNDAALNPDSCAHAYETMALVTDNQPDKDKIQSVIVDALDNQTYIGSTKTLIGKYEKNICITYGEFTNENIVISLSACSDEGYERFWNK